MKNQTTLTASEFASYLLKSGIAKNSKTLEEKVFEKFEKNEDTEFELWQAFEDYNNDF